MNERLAVGYRLFRIEMSVEVACMDASIGTSAACNANLLSYLQTDTFFQLFLNRDSVRLNLPAMITSSVVSQMQEIPFHNSQFIMHNAQLYFDTKIIKIMLLFRKLSYNFVTTKYLLTKYLLPCRYIY